MGSSNSKIEDDKALALCRERKHLVRQALDGRCLLANAHVSYIQSLRNTGTALRKFVDPETPTESYLCPSTSARCEPLASAEISALLFSKSSSSFSRHVEIVESISPVPSQINSVQLHSDHMKASRSFSMTVEEKPPIPVTATLQNEDNTRKDTVSQSKENLATETLPISESPPWDYFKTPHSVESQYSFHDGRGLCHELDNGGSVRQLREEEGSLGLEEEGENVSTNTREDFADSEDDFDKPSTAPLVRIFRNRNEVLDSNSVTESPKGASMETVGFETETETEQRNEQQSMLSNRFHDENSSISTPKATPSVVVHPVNGDGKEQSSANNIVGEVFLSCMKEIEILFLKASESGKEVPRMLEANKVKFRPLFTDDKARKSGVSNFLTSCLSCCSEDVHQPEETAPSEVRALTFHRSASSLSSSSRNFTGVASKDDVEDFSNNIFSSVCMTSGSHASTLDRLYAWERKLHDEVKASGIIRKKYEMKCRLLRNQESRAESPYKIDKTRATVKDLHSRIIVALHRIDSISKKIEDLRDKELQPQLEELIGGLTRMWEMMLDCHKHQHNIIMSVCNKGSTSISVKPESHQQAVLLLEFELNSLSSSFTQWISVHKSYLESINGWLLKCVYPLRHKSSKKGKYLEFCPRNDGAPPIFVTCGDWLTFLKDVNFPAREVETAIQNLLSITTKFLPNQEKVLGNKSKPVEDIQMNETTDKVIWNVDNFQSSLVLLLDQLETFAETSLQKYVVLQKSIDSARRGYEN